VNEWVTEAQEFLRPPSSPVPSGRPAKPGSAFSCPKSPLKPDSSRAASSRWRR